MDTDTPSVSGRRGRVLIAASLLDAWLLFLARVLSRAGYEVNLVTDLDPSLKDPDHGDVLKYFLPNPFCRLTDLKEAAAAPGTAYAFAILGVRAAYSPEEKQKVLALAGTAPLHAVMLRYYRTYFQNMARLVAKDFLQPFIRRSPRVVVERYDKAAWMLRFLASPRLMGIVPHQRIICQGLPPDLGSRTERKYLFNFLGTCVKLRVPIINRLESRFHLSPNGGQQIDIGGKTAGIMWHADRPGSTRERPLNEYLDVMGDTFFTLCLPGQALTTHRALEAIHCGSIPVLPEETASQYDLPLKHGRNCWLVPRDRWEAAMETLGALDRQKVLELQAAVRKLAREEASIPALEKKCLRHLDLE
jgi:hypothetical protein